MSTSTLHYDVLLAVAMEPVSCDASRRRSSATYSAGSEYFISEVSGTLGFDIEAFRKMEKRSKKGCPKVKPRQLHIKDIDFMSL